MYLVANPQVRFLGPGRGLGNPGVWDDIVATLKFEPWFGKWSLPDVSQAVSNAVNAALANATNAVANVQGKVGEPEKAQIDAANVTAIRQAAGGNEALAQAAIARYRQDVQVIYSQTESAANRSNLSTLLLLGGGALVAVLLLRR